MTMKIYEETDIQDIANAIREQNNLINSRYTVDYMSTAIRALRMARDVLPQDEVTGDIANFPDGSDDYPVVELIANIEAIQAGSGDPAPDNIRTITGYTGVNVTRTGKNLYPIKVGFDLWRDNRSATHTTDNDILSITMASENNSGVYGGAGTSLNNALCQTLKKIVGTITVSLYAKASINNSNVYIGFQSFVGTTATLTTEWQKVTISPTNYGGVVPTMTIYNRSGAAITVDIKDVQIEIGSVASDYEAYNGEIKPIYWTSAAGTIYGGSLNVTTGLLTIGWGCFTFVGSDDENWLTNTTNRGFTIEISDMKSGSYQNGKANWLKTLSAGGFGARFGANNSNLYCYQILDNISEVTNLATWKTYLSTHNLTVVYPLGTPQTIQLTPTQVNTILGVNNIYADTGDVDVTYRADVDLYIQKKINEAT